MEKFEGHTPGPWPIEQIYPDSQIFGALTILGADGSLVGKTHHNLLGLNRPAEEAVANAHLIAAAPDLLAEVERLREEIKLAIESLTESNGGHAVGEGNIKDAVSGLMAALANTEKK